MRLINKGERDRAAIERWKEIDSDPRNTFLKRTPRFIMIAAKFGLSYPTVRKIILSSK